MSKKILHIVIGVIALLSVSSKCYAAATPDSVVVFQFITKDETFWADYKENVVNFEKLANFVQQHRQQIMSGQYPVLVKGYCASLPTQELNMQIGKVRSNHVKSYVITHYGFKESMFRTTNFITPLGKLTDVVTISFVLKNLSAQTSQSSQQTQQKQQTTSQHKPTTTTTKIATTTAAKTTTITQSTTPTKQVGAPTVIEPIVQQRIPNLHANTETEQGKTLAKQNFIPAPNTVPKIKEQSSFFNQPAIDKQQTTQQERSFAPKSDELEPPQFYLGKTEIRTKKRKKDNQKQSATTTTEPAEQKTTSATPAPAPVPAPVPAPEAKPTLDVKPLPEPAPTQEAQPVEPKQDQPVTHTPEKVEKKAEITDKSTKAPAKEKQKADKKQPKKQKTKQSTKQPDLKIFETPDPAVPATIVVPSTTEKPAKPAKEKPTKAVKEKPVKQVKETPATEAKEKPAKPAKEKPTKAVKEKPVKQVKEKPAKAAKEQKQTAATESKAPVKAESKPTESPKTDKNKITNNPVVIDLGLFQTEPVVKGTAASTTAAKETKPVKVAKEPKAKPTKVAKTPVVKEPKAKPVKVAKEPKAKPVKVAKEPKAKPVKVAKEPKAKPVKVAKAPVVKEPKVVVEKAPKVVVPRDPSVPLFNYELKTNLLYWALTAPNIEAEFIYNRKLSLNIEGQWAHTDWDKQAKHFRIMQFSPEIRFYPVKTMPLYVGLYYNLGSYNFKFSDTGYQGDFQGAGISLGYKLPIAKRLSLEFELAAGYLSSNIDTYSFEDRCNRYIDSYNRQYITPTKAKVSLVWRIGGAKK